VKNLSKRALNISPSATLAVSARAKELRTSGIDVVAFGVGEPDFDTPDYIKKSAIEAIDAGCTKYTPAVGTPELKKAIADKFQKDNGLTYDPSQVVVCNGGKHVVFNVIYVLCEEGDEVILPSPYWVSYIEQIKLAGATPVIVEGTEENGLRITAEQLDAAITDKTKLMILNSPSNPTGMIYSPKELEEIAEVVAKRDIYVLSDEIYEKLVFGDATHVSIASLGKEIFDRTITMNGVSKTYAMTGWRIGYAAGPKDIMSAIAKVQGHTTSNPNSIAQKAALTAICSDDSAVNLMKAEFDKRRRYVVDRLNAMPGISCLEPEGAFYAFPNVSGLYGKSFNGETVSNSIEFAQVCLEQGHTALVPGSAFGADDCVRVSYATSMEEITKGMDRIEKLARSAS